MKFRLLLLICMLFFIKAATAVEQTVDWQQSLRDFTEKWRADHQVPAVVLWVQSPEKNVTITRGYTTTDGKEPVTPENLFGVGSITKNFIAALALKLSEQGKLSLDAPIGTYIDKYPRWHVITVRQLLNMTSGIKDIGRTLSLEPDSDWTADQQLDMAYQLKDEFEPGKGWGYTDTDYLLLGKIIERVVGKPLEDALSNTLFRPFDLTETYYSETPWPEDVIKKMAHGYYDQIDFTRLNPSNYGADGSMLMTAPDLAKWVQRLFIQQDVLTPSSLQQMLQAVSTADSAGAQNLPPNTGFGLGVFVTQEEKLGQVIWYTGVTKGYSSVFLWVPDKKLLIVAQINRWQGKNFKLLFPQEAFVKKVLEIVVGE